MTEPVNLEGFLSDEQVARQLGVHPVTVRRWRAKNKKAGCIKFGPPYEFRGPNVVYPKSTFSEWCRAVRVVDGVPRMNLPVSSPVVLPVEAARV